MKNKINKRKKAIYTTLAVVFWLVLWQIAAMIYGMDFILPSPLKTFTVLLENIVRSEFWKSVLFSVTRILWGFLLSATLGVLLALVSIKLKIIRILFDPFCSVMRAVPVASFIIFVLILFSSEKVSTVVAFLMGFPLVYSTVSGGIDSAPEKLLEASDLFDLGFFAKLKYIYFPHLLPHITSALAVSVGLCFKSGIAAEVIGYPVGSVGAQMYIAKLGMNMPTLLSYTVVVVLISALCEKLIAFLCRLPIKLREGIIKKQNEK
ncbi:MAG: ABC transporter permease subunit [Clostridia bacterium]|nr:ABC transporter permease subunit [Clostridia bacterium]